MAVKIRLKRMGKKAVPFYRLVVVDSRWRRDGKSIADVGWYDPCKQPAQKSFKEEEIYKWLESGAQLSETVKSMLKKEGILTKFKSGAYKKKETGDSLAEAPASAPEPVAVAGVFEPEPAKIESEEPPE